jgi:hypothetical protein
LIGPGMPRRRRGAGGRPVGGPVRDESGSGVTAGFGSSTGFFGSGGGSGPLSGARTSALIGRSALTRSNRTGAAVPKPVQADAGEVG